MKSIIAICATLTFASVAGADDKIDFDTQIKPILSDRCYQCHGPDARKRKADLRLDLEAAAKQKVIVAGEPDRSELVLRITHDDPGERMPPPAKKLTLSPNEIDLIRRWIKQGATWNEHWAFSPPAETKVPADSSDDWSANEIDRFVFARLRAAKFRPSPAASRKRLIRRLSFDLTGLPPTLEEIDAFVSDKSANAYEKLVDRLLASPAYGERMATAWLDVARYSDTFGYQRDNDRFVWPWRDWVIGAFNDNMPYDKFVARQIAGDLQPGADKDSILATTFNRLHPQKVEGGSTPEEFRIEYVADRTQTFATAFLGLTMECARCHDHKYDPLSQKEYYQLTAFFDNIDEAGLYSFFTRAVPTPTLLLPDDAAKAKQRELDKQSQDAEGALQKVASDRQAAFDAWLKTMPKAASPGQVAHMDFEAFKSGVNQSVPGHVGKGVRLTGDDGIGLKVGNFKRCDPFTVSLWMNTPDVKDRAVVFHRSRSWTDAASRGYQLLIEDGRLSASLIHFWPGNAMRIRTRQLIAVDKWIHVTMTYDGSSRADGLRLYFDGQRAETVVVRDNLYKNITGGGGNNITIGERHRDRGFTKGRVDEFRVFNRQLTSIEVQDLCDGRSLAGALGSKTLTGEQRQQVYEYYLSAVDNEYQKGLAALRSLREQRNKLADGIAEIMVMREMDTTRQTYLLSRGAYDARAEPVEPQTPEVLSLLPPASPRDRRGLTQWLTRRDHPLTARVAVNRVWQLIFGQGIVRTPEDFGRQGQPPTHPQLLDWLAVDFAANGWDIKRLVKQMVMSATYRQSSKVSASTFARDPENRLLARASSYRMPAEMLRDNALATSGLLVGKIGGPPAKPYEVEVSFKPVKRDRGEGLYRRSLYTYWKRTGPAPVMMVLDASKRDVCRVKRERTSTPLEAFVLMNGPQFIEAARVLSERLIKVHGDNTNAILVDMFRLLTGRRPTREEAGVLEKLYTRQLETFAGDGEKTKAYLATGERPSDKAIDATRLAATASVANALFSFDETVMKR